MGKSPKVVRRGCKSSVGPTDPWSPKSHLHHVQPGVAPVQEAFRSLGSKDLLHPPLTTVGDFPNFSPSPSALVCNSRDCFQEGLKNKKGSSSHYFFRGCHLKKAICQLSGIHPLEAFDRASADRREHWLINADSDFVVPDWFPQNCHATLGSVLLVRGFEKGLGDRGGWREEIEIQASFLYPFSYAPLGEGGHISGGLFWLFLEVCLPPTPSRQPLFETSDLDPSAGFEFPPSLQTWEFFVKKCAKAHHGPDPMGLASQVWFDFPLHWRVRWSSLCSAIFARGQLPQAWSVSHHVLLAKPGGGLRPIAIPSTAT